MKDPSRKRNIYKHTKQSENGFLTSQATQEVVERIISKVEKPSGGINLKYFVVTIEEWWSMHQFPFFFTI